MYDSDSGVEKIDSLTFASAGEWKTPFSPLYSNHRDDEYTEGNAWQYSWLVQHDVEGLIALHGGAEAFITKLDSLFTLDARLEGENALPTSVVLSDNMPMGTNLPITSLIYTIMSDSHTKPAVCQQNSDRIISQYSGWPLRE